MDTIAIKETDFNFDNYDIISNVKSYNLMPIKDNEQEILSINENKIVYLYTNPFDDNIYFGRANSEEIDCYEFRFAPSVAAFYDCGEEMAKTKGEVVSRPIYQIYTTDNSKVVKGYSVLNPYSLDARIPLETMVKSANTNLKELKITYNFKK